MLSIVIIILIGARTVVAVDIGGPNSQILNEISKGTIFAKQISNGWWVGLTE